MALNNVAEDIRTILNDAAKGASGTDLFSFQWGFGASGDEIDKQILVTHTDDTIAMIKDEYENPNFNIMVRGETQEGAKSVHDRARDIYEFLIQEKRQIINGTEYIEFAPIAGLQPLGKDANNRFVFSMNFFTFRNSIGV